MLNLRDVLLEQAGEFERRGDLATAEQLYRRSLEDMAEDPPTLLRLGLLLFRSGRAGEALAHLRRSALTPPVQATRLGVYATALARLGRQNEAARVFRCCVALDPGQFEPYLALGNALQDLGRLPAAAGLYGKALAIAPDLGEGHFQLANLRLAQMNGDAAIGHYRRAIACAPERAASYLRLANSLASQRNFAEAARVCRQAAILDPGEAKTFSYLGLMRQQCGRVEAGVAACRQAIALSPESAMAYGSLASILLDRKAGDAEPAARRAHLLDPGEASYAHFLGKALRNRECFVEAARAYRLSLALDPAAAAPYLDLGDSLYRLAQGDASAAACRRALALSRADEEDDSVVPSAHLNLGLALMLTGQWQEGFAEYEWRWRVPQFPVRPRDFSQPAWDGRPFPGKTLLVHAEQGFGDVLQFCRYLAAVAAQGGALVVECAWPLVPLLRQLPHVAAVVASGEPLPAFDLHVPMLSLPWVLGTTAATIPAAVPYLRADADRRARWRRRIPADGRFRVGLIWAGKPVPDPRRSIPLADLSRIAWPDSVALYSLQKGDGEEQLAGWTGTRPIEHLGGDIEDFADFAAAMEPLDLVITIDSAPAHLAGALGKPVWTLLPFAPDWRWLLDRPDSPWYPTMRLFRQQSPGAWKGVVERLAAALAQHLQSGAPAVEGAPC